jgi:hypothetical protein
LGGTWSDAAAWVQAIGTIAAVVGSGWVAARESRWARQREEQARLEAVQREAHSLFATKTAALNLAILAATQIHELHVLLRDEVRRGRIARVSPSRALITNEHLLTAFPIQSLGDAEAMVAFAYFPGALAMAAEVYANLEAAVRNAVDGHEKEIFAEYAQQMGQLDRVAQERLTALRLALEEPLSDAHVLQTRPNKAGQRVAVPPKVATPTVHREVAADR